ncbi:MAG: hypothetical protein K8J31_09790 [Anaerolineae bacterium]|nr:hypothetical protein [Anaerolineae bacterium]
MSDVENLLEALDEMPLHQLEQLNRLLEAFHRYLPRDSSAAGQPEPRATIISRAVAKLRAGMTDAELDRLIFELKMH